MTGMNFGGSWKEKELIHPRLPISTGVDRRPLPYTAISGEVITDYKQVPLPFRAWYDGTLTRFCATEEEARQHLEKKSAYKGRFRW